MGAIDLSEIDLASIIDLRGQESQELPTWHAAQLE
jgi:hypothetical protein